MQGMEDNKHLSYASSLCGACTEVCPVHINIHELLIDNRREAVLEGYSTIAERVAWKAWKKASLSRKLMNSGNAKLKNWVVNKMVKGWSKQRGDIQFSKKTFNEMWQDFRTDL